MTYLLDTNILLIYIRDKSVRQIIENTFQPFHPNNRPVISVVTVGEIKSIAKRNKWGIRKILQLESILSDLIIADINSEDVIEMYAEIDTFSQGKLENKPLNQSARNMGKNDLWIAATAAVLQAKLLTTDKDFQHLNEVYFELFRIEV